MNNIQIEKLKKDFFGRFNVTIEVWNWIIKNCLKTNSHTDHKTTIRKKEVLDLQRMLKVKNNELRLLRRKMKEYKEEGLEKVQRDEIIKKYRGKILGAGIGTQRKIIREIERRFDVPEIIKFLENHKFYKNPK